MQYKKEKVITSKSSCNVQTAILYINYTETKCSIKANMSKHRLAKNKKDTYQYIVWATQIQTVTKNSNSPATIIFVNLYDNIKFT